MTANKDSVRVTFNWPHTTWDGKSHKPETTASLSRREARHVLTVGHGRLADAPDKANQADTTEGEG